MKKFSASLAILLLAIQSFGQGKFKPDEEYSKHSRRAYHFYEDKQYMQSGLSYDTLFKNTNGQGSVWDKYNAACSWALAGDTNKAFSYLQEAIGPGKWSNLSHISADADLNSLHADARWQPLLDTVKSNKEKAEVNLNKSLVAQLDTIYRTDQSDRQNYEPIRQRYGIKSRQMDSLWKRVRFYDSVNLAQVKKIIDTYGWLGPDEIGEQGATALFLVIQHSDSLTQVTYVPKMREAVKKGKAQPESLALLEDRILTNQHKPQIYGSQVKANDKTGKYEFFPILDEPNVNKRRASVGLGPLEDYAKYFGIDYVLPKK